jgi:CRP-like cAMP-binding protein
MSEDTFGFAAGLPVRRHELESGDPLFRAGDRVSRFFFVSEGAVRLVRPLETGSSAIMQIARQGEWLAEASLFSSRYHCDAVCARRCVLTSVSKAQLIARLGAECDQAMALAQWLSIRLRELRQLDEIVRVRSAKARVMRWLEWKCDKRSGRLDLTSTWSEIADELALTREALYRVIAELKRARALRIDGRTVTLIRCR